MTYEQQDMARVAHNSGKLLLSLIDDVLQFNKLQVSYILHFKTNLNN